MLGDHNNIELQLLTPDIVIIREVYDSENAYEKFEQQLEKALDKGYSKIVIEPVRLGDETGRWIYVGNCLHKTAVLSGMAAVVVGSIWREEPLAVAPLAATSWFCTALYTVSWQFDPCCQYQVESTCKIPKEIPLSALTPETAPVVLVKRGVRNRVILHSSVTTIAAVFCMWRLYVGFK